MHAIASFTRFGIARAADAPREKLARYFDNIDRSANRLTHLLNDLLDLSKIEAGRLQIQTTRIQGQIFADGAIPTGYTPVNSATHNLIVTSYYVSPSSTLINGVPTLRRHRLIGGGAGGPRIVDEEVAPGVENLQLQLGVDVDQDNTVDRYVNPGDPIYNPNAVGYVPGARVITARVWLIVRSVGFEAGIQDSNDYKPGDVGLGVQNDSFRRMQVSKTILLRNART